MINNHKVETKVDNMSVLNEMVFFLVSHVVAILLISIEFIGGM